MYSPLRLAFKYLLYWIRASNGKGHGVHSPFVFDFVTNVLRNKSTLSCGEAIEARRNKLLADQRVITVDDFGAGSSLIKTRERKVAAIAKSSLKPKKYAVLLCRIAHYFEPALIVELGTSLGITSAYLASVPSTKKLFTFEGAASIAKIAAEQFRDLQLDNVDQRLGQFEKTLPEFIASVSRIDLFYLDGNHQKKPTLDYFNQLLSVAEEPSVFVFDDIHWSAEMEEAWEVVKAHESVTMSIDLFFIGIIFLRKDFLVRQHFTIRF